MMPETAILAAIGLPVVGAFLIILAGAKPNLREAVTLVTATGLFGLVLIVLSAVVDGGRPEATLIEMFPGLSLSFKVEPLGATFGVIASGLWILTSLYAIGYMRGHHEKNQTRFYACFALALSSTIGVAFAGNMLTLFTFYEILSVCTYPLVTHSGTPEA
jgi:multicomponent Na+:H+ antiporter subunit D